MTLSHNNEHNGEVCVNAHSEIASSHRGPWEDPVHGKTLCIAKQIF